MPHSLHADFLVYINIIVVSNSSIEIGNVYRFGDVVITFR